MIFDNETTDLTLNRSLRLEMQPHVWEFYGLDVDLDTGEERGSLHVWARPPPGRIAPGAAKATGISDEALAKHQPISASFGQIKKFLEAADGVVAHNLRFDMDVIEIEGERLGETLTWPPPLCSIEATMFLKGRRLTLTELHQEMFEKGFDGAHGAKADVEALARCCVELRRREMI